MALKLKASAATTSLSRQSAGGLRGRMPKALHGGFLGSQEDACAACEADQAEAILSALETIHTGDLVERLRAVAEALKNDRPMPLA